MNYIEQQLGHLSPAELRASYDFYVKLFRFLNLNVALTHTHSVKLVCEMKDHTEYEEYILFLNLLHMRGIINIEDNE